MFQKDLCIAIPSRETFLYLLQSDLSLAMKIITIMTSLKFHNISSCSPVRKIKLSEVLLSQVLEAQQEFHLLNGLVVYQLTFSLIDHLWHRAG